MKVGYLGVGDTGRDVAFEVSSEVVKTFHNMKLTQSVAYTLHKIHGHKAIPEMTGLEADTITFDIILSAYLGVNPQAEIDKLHRFMNDGTICNLVIGENLFGTWAIKSMPLNIEYFYKEGDITHAKATISLVEAWEDYSNADSMVPAATSSASSYASPSMVSSSASSASTYAVP